jgi:hypothetical protein
MARSPLLLLLFSAVAFCEPSFNLFNWRYLLAQPCPYAADPVASVTAALASALAGQHAAVRGIQEEVQAWVEDRSDGVFRPLVLMFTGSTGLGKSDAALAVARGLLAPQDAWLAGALPPPLLPKGLLELSGVRFQDAHNISQLREELRGALAQALYDCHGHAVLVFDEVQKVDKRVLSELLPVMQGERSRVYHAGYGGGVKPLDASRMVVILVSDAGLQVLEGGAAGARQRLHRKLVEALNAEFSESGMPLGSLVQSIVPFINLNGGDVPAVVAHHLAHARLPAELRDLADGVCVEPAALTALSSMAYVPYTSWVTMWEPEKNQTEPQRMQTDACQHDAALLELRQQQRWQQGEAPVRADGSQGVPPEGDSPMLCGAPCAIPESCVTMRGARSVMHQSTTPVKRLLKLLGRYGAAGALLRARPSPEEMRHAFKSSHEARGAKATAATAAAAAAAAGARLPEEPSLRVELRVTAACDLPAVRTPGMCTKEGLPGAGIRVQRCVLISNCPACGPEEKCETLFEGELPP